MKKVFVLIKKTIIKWQEDKASRLAAALAFYAILSIPPMLVLAIGIAGQIIGKSSARQTIITEADQFLGPEAMNAISTILDAASQPQGLSLATVVSLGVLFFSASGVFVQLQDAMNTVWDVMPDPDQGIITTVKKRGISFLMVLAIGGLLLLLLLVNSLIAVLGQFLSEVLPFSLTWGRLLNYGFSFIILTGLIALLFKVIPDVKIQWRDVWVGALVTALLIVLGVFGISLYLTYSDPTSSYGAAGSFIVLLLWIYISCQILFIGAEFTQVFATRFGEKIKPDEDAVFMPGARDQALAKEKS